MDFYGSFYPILWLQQNGNQKVGYLANLHMMAYQGKENLVGRAMTEVQAEFNVFRKRNEKPGEKTAFAVISGDFNIDNISPGVLMCINHTP